MEIVKTKSPIELLKYLETYTYKDLPIELWDETLFFYKTLVTLMSLSVREEMFDKVLLFKVVNNGSIAAIAIYETDSNTIQFIGETKESFNCLITYMEQNQYQLDTLILIHETLALNLMKEAHLKLNYADIKFYKRTKNNPTIGKLMIKEIDKTKAHFLWDGVIDYIDQGIQYYGGFSDNQIKCCAGISRLSRSRSEIIAVHTFKEEDKQKGYASTLCNKLVDIALDKVNIVTWTASYSNRASVKTANKIGMNKFISLFNFKCNDLLDLL